MSAAKRNNSFQPPVPRPQPQLWYAVYALPRKTFLEAVEQIAPQLPSPREGVHWEFEGFKRHKLFLCPVPDSDDSGEYFRSAEFGLDACGDQTYVYVESANDGMIQLFKNLMTELDSLDHVAQACIEPCSAVNPR